MSVFRIVNYSPEHFEGLKAEHQGWLYAVAVCILTGDRGSGLRTCTKRRRDSFRWDASNAVFKSECLTLKSSDSASLLAMR
jgi:hypothetical protein